MSNTAFLVGCALICKAINDSFMPATGFFILIVLGALLDILNKVTK